MKATRTVILWGREDMLVRGLELFLQTRNDWEVIRISDEQDADFLFSEMERTKANVVIIYHGDYDGETKIPFQLITQYPNVKVMTVSLESNSIDVYNKQEFLVKEVEDLFSIVDA